jgi:DNA-binding SARP family transcriptional activator
VRLLGGFEARREGRVLEGFQTQKARALLAYLLLHRDRAVLRGGLASLLWPDESEARAQRNLRQAVYNLRATIAPRAGSGARPILIVGKQQLQVDPAATLRLDVEAFETRAWAGLSGRGQEGFDDLTAANQLYGGELLAGFRVKNSATLEAWLDGERERLRDLAVTVVKSLLAHCESRGDPEAGIRFARRLALIDSPSEEAHRYLMHFYALSGRRAKALAQFSELKKLLHDDLGVEPGPETMTLYSSIALQQAPFRQIGGSEPPGPFVPLVGRDTVLRQLGAAWTAVHRGGARITFVEGEPGIGKSRLVRTFVHQALLRDSAIVLQGRCREPQVAGHDDALAEALSSVELESGDASRDAALLAAMHDVARHLPAIRELRPDIGPPAGKRRRAPSVAAAAAAVATLLRQLSRPPGARHAPPPVILLLDNLELSSPASIALLRGLAHTLRDDPVWMIGACRSGPSMESHALQALIADLAAAGAASRVRLDRLDASHLDQLAAGLVSDRDAERLAVLLEASCHGLPLAVAETLNLLVSEGLLAPESGVGWVLSHGFGDLPRTLPELITRRITGLPTASRRLLTVAAVMGETFDLELLRAVEREHEVVIEAAIGVLIERWLVRPALRRWTVNRRQRDIVLWSGGVRWGSFEFAHATIRDVVYERLDPRRRSALHRRIAETLVERAAGSRPEDARLVAHHRALAGAAAGRRPRAYGIRK